jgi:hypothetical protein
VRPPWESEDAAFSLLLRVLAVALVVIALSFALKAIF